MKNVNKMISVLMVIMLFFGYLSPYMEASEFSLETKSVTDTESEVGSDTESEVGSEIEKESVVADPVLEACIKEHLGLEKDAVLTKEEMLNVNSINNNCSGVSDLTGLEFATNLTNLSVAEGTITDVTPLADLQSLALLDLSYNNITDISALEEGIASQQIAGIAITGNAITDFSVLNESHNPAELLDEVGPNDVINFDDWQVNINLAFNQDIQLEPITVYNDDVLTYDIVGSNGEVYTYELGKPTEGTQTLTTNFLITSSEAFNNTLTTELINEYVADVTEYDGQVDLYNAVIMSDESSICSTAIGLKAPYNLRYVVFKPLDWGEFTTDGRCGSIYSGTVTQEVTFVKEEEPGLPDETESEPIESEVEDIEEVELPDETVSEIDDTKQMTLLKTGGSEFTVVFAVVILLSLAFARKYLEVL